MHVSVSVPLLTECLRQKRFETASIDETGGRSPAVEAAVDVRVAEANSFHDVDVLSAERIRHSRRDTTLLCGFPRISMQLEHLASPVRRNECEICIERRRARLALRGLAERTCEACAA